MRGFRVCLIGLAIALAACGKQEPDPLTRSVSDDLGPGEVAIVNGERIPESIFSLYTLNMLQADAEDLTDEGRAAVIERLVQLMLLAQEAEQRGLNREPEIAAELELARMNALARHMTTRFTAENPPSESELRELYQENIESLLNTRYKTRHILVDSEAEARRLISMLDDGADFAELAAQHSTDSSTADDGGDLGWMTPGSLVQPYSQAMQATEPGTYTSAPVQTQYGWHVILVEDREERVAPGLDAVREDLLVEAREAKLRSFVESLKEEATLERIEQ